MSMSSGVYVINIRTLCRKTNGTLVVTIGSHNLGSPPGRSYLGATGSGRLWKIEYPIWIYSSLDALNAVQIVAIISGPPIPK